MEMTEETSGQGGARRVNYVSRTANPVLSCRACGREGRFKKMKRSDEWALEYRGGSVWIIVCRECSDGGGRSLQLNDELELKADD